MFCPEKKYRRLLGIDQVQVHSVFLKGLFTLLEERIAGRTHEFMTKELLQSQLETLEEPETGLVVDISGTLDQISQTIIDKLLC